jgi:hypothetical protein
LKHVNLINACEEKLDLTMNWRLNLRIEWNMKKLGSG